MVYEPNMQGLWRTPCIGSTLELEMEAMSGQKMVLESWATWQGAVYSKCSVLDHVLRTAGSYSKLKSRLGPDSLVSSRGNELYLMLRQQVQPFASILRILLCIMSWSYWNCTAAQIICNTIPLRVKDLCIVGFNVCAGPGKNPLF